MPTSASSLSVAIQATADFIAGHMADDVVVSIDAPQRAQKQAEGSDSHILNLFVYRLAPSGFHADTADEEPTFIRANLLLTAFPAGNGNPPPDSDLRVLGQAIRVLQSKPVIPTVLPGAPTAGDNADFRKTGAGKLREYRLQAVLQAPTMEELNHIWTTQGGELAYRLSAAYELALIPIEPLTHITPAPPVQTGEMEFAVGPGRGPFQMFLQGGRLFSAVELGNGAADATVSITGEPKMRVAVVVQWNRAGGTSDTQPPQLFELKTWDVDKADARFQVVLQGAATGDRAALQTVLIDDDDEPMRGVAAANHITLAIGA